MMRKVGLPVLPSESHNLPVMGGGAHPARRPSKKMAKRRGIYVQPTGAPTAPCGGEMNRGPIPGLYGVRER
ncbi:hypothetical protein GCM10007886_10510 [Methylobacterium gregans]|uniref:Uncharacterized protein n=1 Tax=Methylobacterium gregans TaxID=374424 RepID=A0AA37HQV1_9HYPH|nr:7-keto-8-aminopelargonate synthetase-like enzyme [Methylobacterium gregans]GJD79267.1 hypothetical protein NBEOAGPD_2491 [Methylobacterium gregans]GLS52868.1 hypothetical protein GCM10007886_10510 [Methylobacterium gregans]